MAAMTSPTNGTQVVKNTEALAALADGVSLTLVNLGILLDAVNAPEWLTGVPADASPSAELHAQFAPASIDVFGQIYAMLNQIIAAQKVAATDRATILSNQEKIMATQADIQAAADAIMAGVTTLQSDVAQLTTADAALDTAVTNLTTYVKNNPATPIPAALLTELENAQTNLATVHTSIAGTSADLTTQTGNLAGATPVVTLVSIAVMPVNPSVSMAASPMQQFTAEGTMSDGTAKDMTASATWASDTPATATVAAGGLATLVAPGTAKISATSGSVTGSTVMTVTA